jgi:hypothetical protein
MWNGKNNNLRGDVRKTHKESIINARQEGLKRLSKQWK